MLRAQRFAVGLCLIVTGVRAEQPSPAAGQIAEVRSLLDSGDLKRADALVNELLHSYPGSGAVYEFLGRVRDEEHKYQEAEAAYKRAIELAPAAADPHVSLGVSYVRRGLSGPALEEFRSALKRDPDNLAALLNAASLEVQGNRPVEAEEHYRRAAQLAPGDPVPVLGLASAAFAAGHKDLANQAAQALSRADSVPVYFSLGLLFAKNALYADAEREFERVASSGAKSAEVLLNLAMTQSAQQKYERAKENYFQAIDLNPDDPAPYVHVGQDYLAQNKSNFALAWLYRASKLDHEAPDTLYLLAQAMLKEEYFQTAHEYLSKYVQARPSDAKGWLLMGDAYLEDERVEDALASYRKALLIVPELATAHYLVGNAEYLLRNYKEARKELLVALRLDPTHPEAQLRLGEIEFRDNEDEAAAARFRRLVSAHPADSEAAYDLAKVCMRHDRYSEASELLARAVAQSPEDIRFHYLLSQVYRHLNQEEQSSQEAATYARLKAEQDYYHRYIRHSHQYVE